MGVGSTTMSEPVVIGPGDLVLIPVVESLPRHEVEELSAQLRAACPGVRFGVIAGTPMTHALVYRTPESHAVEYCAWCPTPRSPSPMHHPGGTPVHSEGVDR